MSRGDALMASVDATFTRRKILRDELIGLYGVVERNLYLTKRYFLWDLAFLLWTIANTLTIVFISRGVDLSAAQRNELATKLLVGGVIWAFLGIIFEIVTETVAWERWEGTIEYTFMAPLSRPVHLIGMGIFAVLYGIVRASLVFGAIAAMFHLHMPRANFVTAIVIVGIASVSFIGIGMMTAVLPLISPEKGTQFGFIGQGLMLVVSGVYYPVSVLPAFMQWIPKVWPANYALRGMRHAILNGAAHGPAWAPQVLRAATRGASAARGGSSRGRSEGSPPAAAGCTGSTASRTASRTAECRWRSRAARWRPRSSPTTRSRCATRARPATRTV